MAARTNTDHVTAVLIDRWHTVADNSLTFDSLVLTSSNGIWHDAGMHYYFTDTDGTHHAVPEHAVRGLTYDDR